MDYAKLFGQIPNSQGGIAAGPNQNMSSMFGPTQTEQKIKELSQATVKPKSYTKQELFTKMDKAVAQGYTPEEAYTELLKSAKSKGYIIEGVDIDKELGINQPPEIDTTTFLGKLEQAGRERIQKTEEIQSSNSNFFSKQLQLLGQKAGAFSDIVGAGVSEALSTITPDSIENKVLNEVRDFMQSQGVKDTVKTAKEVYDILPESVQKNVEALGNIGLGILDVVGTGQVAKIAKPVVTAGVKTTGKVVSGIAKAPITGLKEGFKQSYGFDADTITQVLKNNSKFKELKNIPVEEVGRNIADDVVKGIETRLDDLSEVGKGYQGIRKTPGKFKVDMQPVNEIFLKNGIKFKGINKIDFIGTPLELDVNSQKAIQTAYDFLRKKKNITAEELLNARKSIDSIIDYRSEASTQAKAIVRQMRGALDEQAKTKIPGLKELDAQFAPEKELLNKVRGYIYQKDGSLKDNYIQTISNITGKGKEIKLEMLEKISPDLSAQVKMYKALQDIDRIKEGFKVGTYRTTIPGIAGAGVGFATGGPVGAVVGPLLSFMVFNPTTGIKILNAIAKIERGLSGIVGKVKNGIKLTTEELSKLIKSLATNLDTIGQQAKTKVGEGFDKLADKTGAKLNFISDKGTGISGKIEPKKLLPKIDAPKELIEEARKYKSAEEFVKEQQRKIGDMVYALNKKAKEGRATVEFIEDSNYEDGGFFKKIPQSPQTTLFYDIKDRIVKKIGTPTGDIHLFPPKYLTKGYTIGDNYFHLPVKYDEILPELLERAEKIMNEKISPKIRRLEEKYNLPNGTIKTSVSREYVGDTPIDKIRADVFTSRANFLESGRDLSEFQKIATDVTPSGGDTIPGVNELNKEVGDLIGNKIGKGDNKILYDKSFSEGISQENKKNIFLTDEHIEYLRDIENIKTESKLKQIWQQANK